jgi:hypothetical protein
MTFSHKLLWDTVYVRQRLIERNLSERAQFAYFLALLTWDWLSFTFGQLTPREAADIFGEIDAWQPTLIVIFGAMYLYRCNGAAQGEQFVSRYFVIGSLVVLRLLPLVALLIGLSAVFFYYGHMFAGRVVVATGGTILNLIGCWRVGVHLRVIANVQERTM